MTASITTPTTASSDVGMTTDAVLPTFDAAVAKIIEETGRPEQEAVAGLEFIGRMAAKARTGARCGTVGTHHLTYEEMAEVGYAVMDDVMEHNEPAEPDSAHSAIQAHFLNPGEFGLIHANPSGKAQDCTVTVSVGFV